MRKAWPGSGAVVYAGVANSKSALQIAKDLESFLGAGHECPRWTRYRLYGLTRKQIAGGRRGGLYSGVECKEQGVAYKALRLARTEIQYIHHLAAQETRKRMPFVKGERIVLSPAHPRHDICDETIEAAPNGDGVYPVGAVQLPLHPNCICTQLSVLMAEDAFVDRLQGWMNRLGTWRELDEYARWVGMGSASVGSPFASPYLAGLELALQLWLLGDEDDHEARLAEAA